MNRLQNKHALVTGGGRGIGLAIVNEFLTEGAVVMACGRGQRPAALPGEVYWQVCDVSSRCAVEYLGEALQEKFGGVDIVVNNAGVQLEKTLPQSTDQDWELVMGTNAKGTFNVCRELIPLLNAGASIINIGSISANVADPQMALYNASKAFVHGLTRSIAVDHGPAIRCNAISPGWIATEMSDSAFALAKSPDIAKQDAINRHAIGRLGRVEDVAKLASWLASDDSAFATGQCYTLDGGLTAASPLRPALS